MPGNCRFEREFEKKHPEANLVELQRILVIRGLLSS